MTLKLWVILSGVQIETKFIICLLHLYGYHHHFQPPQNHLLISSGIHVMLLYMSLSVTGYKPDHHDDVHCVVFECFVWTWKRHKGGGLAIVSGQSRISKHYVRAVVLCLAPLKSGFGGAEATVYTMNADENITEEHYIADVGSKCKMLRGWVLVLYYRLTFKSYVERQKVNVDGTHSQGLSGKLGLWFSGCFTGSRTRWNNESFYVCRNRI